MDDIYKILIAAVVGFALNPVTEKIKLNIAARDNKKKLINKLSISKEIFGNAIRTLNKTCISREAYINQNNLKHPGFFLPFIKPQTCMTTSRSAIYRSVKTREILLN